MNSTETENKDLTHLTLEETLEQLAAANFSYRDMAIYIGYNIRSFKKLVHTKDSAIQLAIHRGRLKADYAINQKLSQNAQSGNLTTIQQFENIKEKKHVENVIDQIFNLDESE